MTCHLCTATCQLSCNHEIHESHEHDKVERRDHTNLTLIHGSRGSAACAAAMSAPYQPTLDAALGLSLPPPPRLFARGGLWRACACPPLRAPSPLIHPASSSLLYPSSAACSAGALRSPLSRLSPTGSPPSSSIAPVSHPIAPRSLTCPWR